MSTERQRCKDGGVCHHLCKRSECFRERTCVPLSVSEYECSPEGGWQRKK